MKPEAVLKPTDFLMLQALEKKPMTSRELSHMLQRSVSSIVERLKVYEKHGLVVRGQAHRWHAAIVVWVAPAADRVTAVTKPDKATEATIGALEAVGASVRASEQSVPTLPQPKPVEKPYEPPRTRQKASPKAERLAARFNIPAVLPEGELTQSAVASCIGCRRGTPFKYGTTAMCPKCSRGGK